MDKIDKSWRTAITRRSASLPVRWLHSKRLIGNTVLDFGCGKGKDIEYLNSMGHLTTGYDPHHRTLEDNTYALLYHYDTVVCNYVLNVLPKDKQRDILFRIKSCLREGCCAYITVRRDITKEGYTSRGTFQRNVTLGLPVVHKTSGYCIYKLER